MKHYTQNRKARLAAGIAAATLAFGAAAPAALAQDATAVNGGVAQGGDVLFADATQFQFAAQGQFGDAVADDEGVAVVASEQHIIQNQVNAGFGTDFDLDGIEDTLDEDDDNDGVFDHFE